MRKLFVAFTVLLGSLAFVATSNPAGAAGPVTKCPQMTDSINRLYMAYFLREPEPGANGYGYWLDVYANKPDGLAEMSNNFAISQEFITRYGTLSNREFVERVYQNVLGRPAEQRGLDHWTNALDNGFPRGSVMISFSESEEYVQKTRTVAPVAGYLQWFQGDVRFTCNSTTGALHVTVNGQTAVNTSSSPTRPTTTTTAAPTTTTTTTAPTTTTTTTTTTQPQEPAPDAPLISSLERTNPVNDITVFPARPDDEVTPPATVTLEFGFDQSGAEVGFLPGNSVLVNLIDPLSAFKGNYTASLAAGATAGTVEIPVDDTWDDGWHSVQHISVFAATGDGKVVENRYTRNVVSAGVWQVQVYVDGAERPDEAFTHTYDLENLSFYVVNP